MEFNPADFKPVVPAPQDAASSFNASDFKPVGSSMDGVKAPAGNAGFFQPTVDRAKQFVNNDQESVSDFASRKASTGIFGMGALLPAKAEDLASGNIVGGGLKIPGKALVNVLSDVPNLVADVGGFMWQTFAHPIDTVKTVAADPIGFAEGMVGDMVTQPISGLATSVKDLFSGKGAGKAGEDALDGFKKGMIAFADRPITSIIQLKLAKGLATDPIGTVKDVAKDTANMATKPWQAIYNFAKDPKQAVVDVGNAVQAKYDTIKSIPSFFTKEGQTKIAQGTANQVMEYAQNNIKINDLQERLNNLDVNSKEYTQAQNELNIAQQRAENAQKSIDLLTSHFADETGKTFAKGGYNDASEFTSDANGVVDGMYKSKDYAGALNPNGQPVNISDVSPITDYLSEQGAKLEAQGNPDSGTFKTAASELQLRHDITQAGGIDAYVDNQVNQKLVADGIDATKTPAKYFEWHNRYNQDIKDELMKKIADKPSFYSWPLTADDLFSYMNNLREKMKSNYGSKIIADQNIESKPTLGLSKAAEQFTKGGDTSNYIETYDNAIKSGDAQPGDVYKDVEKKIYQPKIATQLISDAKGTMVELGHPEIGDMIANKLDANNLTPDTLLKAGQDAVKQATKGTGATAKSITMEVLNRDLSKVDPNAPARLATENQKFSDLKNIWDKWSEKKFDNTGSMIKFITSDKNWADFQSFPKEIISKFQNTLVSYIIDSAKNTDGTTNFEKLSKLTQEFSPNLTANHKGALSELSYANNLPQDVHDTPAINKDLRNIMTAKGELSANEKAMTDNERKIENLKANIDVVGTTPEKIAMNLKSIQTMDDLQSFMKAANIKDPKQLGDLITGTLYDQMQQQFGTNKGVNFQNMAELVKQVRDIGKSSPLGEQLKQALFSPEKQVALEEIEKQSQVVSDIIKNGVMAPLAKRLFHAAFGAVSATLGWHVTSIRNFFEAVKPDGGPKEKISPDEAGLNKLSSSKKTTKSTVVPKIKSAVGKATPAAEGLQNASDIPDWFKSEAQMRGFDGDLKEAWAGFNDHVNNGGQ